MASGSFTGTTGNKYIKARINWSSTPNTLSNQSSVTADLYYGKSSSSSSATYGNGSFTITINGTSKTIDTRITLNPDNTWVKVGSHTVTVPHTSDGTKSIQISATGGIPGLTFSTTNCSATVTLDKIPRATTPSFSANQTIGAAMTISLSPADSSFYHTLTYSWGPSTFGTIGTNIGTSASWTIPMSFCSGVPNGVEGTVYITAETFTSAGVSLGTVTRTATCTVPASVVPTISAIAISDTGNNVPSSWGVYVRGKSRIHVNATAAGVYSSRIVGYSIRGVGVTVASNDVDLGVIPNAGTVSIEVTVTDSRGRTATATQSVNAADYFEPTVEAFSVVRANSSGTATDNGTYAKIPLKVSGASVDSKNTVEAKIYHKRSDLTDWTLARTISVAYSVDQTVMIANMVASRSYAIKLEVSDAFSTTVSETMLNAEGAVMGWMPGGIGISFGKAAEEEYTADFDWKIHGRKGATFDQPVDATGYKINGKSVLQLVDVLSVYRGTNMQLGASMEYVSADFSTVACSLNGLLTISNGGVLIPAGVRAVKVSAQICLGSATAGARFAQISKNNFTEAIARSQKQHSSTNVPETHVFASALSLVTTGDIILIGVYGDTADWIYGNSNQTYLTVEAYA